MAIGGHQEKGDREPPQGVLERGLHILRCFTQDHPTQHLRDLTERSGLNKATVLRALRTLVDFGFLQRSANGSYSPGPANLRLAALFRSTTDFIVQLEGPIQRISEKTKLSASFFVRSQDQRVCLVRDRAKRDFQYFIEVGASVPLSEGGAAAQVLLAFTERETSLSDQIRRDNYYVSWGERNRHLAAVSVPVFREEAFLGALVVTGLQAELTREILREHADLIHRELDATGLASQSPMHR